MIIYMKIIFLTIIIIIINKRVKLNSHAIDKSLNK